MSIINILSPHVADMIAAGEVVERPASVIKELVENSVDAGAHNITVEIQNGGATYIRVTDDGCGMSPEDAGVAFLRHATSKLRDEHGLEAIGTMGFRGEALAAISSVSRIELVTRRRGDTEGTKVVLEAGDIQSMGAVGCPEGTTMTVRDLFYNTPARLKFLKSDRSESSACAVAALRCALGHPGVSVKLIRDGKEEFFSPGDGRMDSCIYSLLGRDMAANMLACTGDVDGITVSGFVSSPSCARGNRSQQYFFCNGRFIKSALLQAALEQAYKNTLLTGRYPSCVLYVGMGFGAVDVNVHPAKTEVKFSDEKKVFDAVYYAVRSALEGESRTAEVKPSASTVKKAEPKRDFYQTMSAESFRNNGYQAAKKSDSAPAMYKPVLSPATTFRDTGLSYQTHMEIPESAPKPLEKPRFTPLAGSKAVEKPVQNVEKPEAPTYKIVGEAMKTYIIIEQGDSMILIDKHAAHERMIFDRLKSQNRETMSQTLLMPVNLRPTEQDAQMIEENGEMLAQLGFEIEPFGERDYVVRAVPADMDAGDVAPAIEEICGKLRKNRTLDAQSMRDEVLHTVACKAAIKAGWDNHIKELERVADAVMSGAVKYCPHGRPVSVVMTRKELDKMFKRIV